MVYDNSPEALKKRFMLQVHKYGDGCWLWVGSKLNNGYGKIQFKRKNILAHRMSYTLFKGQIDEKMEIHHRCRNRACVNPEHLEQVTSIQNQKERIGFKERDEIKKIKERTQDLDFKSIHRELKQIIK